MKIAKEPLLILTSVIFCLLFSNCDEPTEGRFDGSIRWGIPNWGPYLVLQYVQGTEIRDATVENCPFRKRIIVLGPELYAKHDIRNTVTNSYAGQSTYEWIYAVTGLWDDLTTANGDFTFSLDRFKLNLFSKIDISYGSKDRLAETILDLKVISLDNYDKNHPSGSSIADIAYLEYLDYYGFVNRGYNWDNESMGNGPSPVNDNYWKSIHFGKGYSTTQYGDYGIPCALNHIRIDRISANPLRFINFEHIFFILSKPPTKPGTYNFRIIFTIQLPVGNYPARQLEHEFSMTIP